MGPLPIQLRAEQVEDLPDFGLRIEEATDNNASSLQGGPLFSALQGGSLLVAGRDPLLLNA